MAGTDFLYIPPTIRQDYIPFRHINGVYSFKSPKATRGSSNNMRISPFPATLKEFFNFDTELPPGISGYETFCDLIPSAQIREYQPDARLTQTLKWFSYFKKGIDAGMGAVEGGGTADPGKVREIAMAKIQQLSQKLKEFTSGEAGLLDGFASLADYEDVFGSKDGAVLAVPWILYYQLNTTTTTNVYEVPILMKERPLFSSNGTYGWKGGSSNSLGELISGSSNKLVTAALDFLGMKEIKLDKMPVFDPSSSESSSVDTVTIELTLVNDTNEAAVNNFLFCHNLFGNNRWMQYGFVQVSSALYDVYLPGANRYWMCTGNFKAVPVGTLREPSQKIKDGIMQKGMVDSAKAHAEMLNSEIAEAEKAAQKITAENQRAIQAMNAVCGSQTPDQALASCASEPAPEGEESESDKAAREQRNAVNAQKAQTIVNGQKAQNESAEAQAKVQQARNIANRRKSANSTAADLATIKSGKAADIVDKVKIPDAYKVTLTFTPILPDNFNSFIYGWRADPATWDIMNGGKTTPGTERPWVYEKVVEKIISIFQ